MSQAWADRERQTNRLVRAAAEYALARTPVSSRQLYGLCRLSWITSSFEDDNAAYIRSTKIPALGDVFKEDFSGYTLEEVADRITELTGEPSFKPLVMAHSGFTNFYKAYRNTARAWLKEHRTTLLPLFRRAFSLGSDEEGLKLVKAIERLPGVPKANDEVVKMRAQFLLTPVFFALDPRLRFPLINGNAGVQSVLRKLKVGSASLSEQYQKLIGLYGTGGIRDAADLDQVGRDLKDFVAPTGTLPKKALLSKKPTEGHELTLKDEKDIERLQKALTVTSKRVHNTITNSLGELLRTFTLLEGSHGDAMFDVLVKNYDGEKNDLLIEAKSSIETPDIRMAIGQLFDYWYRLNGAVEPHLAVVVPEKPTEKCIEMLDWLGIGVLWCNGDCLETEAEWLEHLATG